MLALAVALALAAPPKHPWTSFKPGALAQYVSGSTEFRRGALQLVKVTLKRTQKISNGASSKDDVVVSADVPGGTVTWTSHLELNGVMKSELSQQALDFGR